MSAPKDRIYLPGLNGIRAIASIAVVISHTTLALAAFGLNPFVLGKTADGGPETLDMAGYGVTMFFTLSGFLITYLLCKEKNNSPINVKKFYIRRILRIWPLYYSYFILCIFVYLLFNVDFEVSSLPYYIFFTANIPFIIGGILPFLSHFWSLAVEEQFYIFWPWVNKLKLKQLLIFIITMIVLMIGTKTILHIFHPNSIVELFIHVTRFHCMLIGAIAALLYFINYSPLIKFATNKMIQLICWAAIGLVLINKFHFISFLDNEILTGITAIIIIGQITKKSPINLENRYFDFLGKISYGIYVFHPLLIFLFSKLYCDISYYNPLNYAYVYSVVLVTTIIISYLSYTYFESYFIKLKSTKYSVIHSENSMKTTNQ